MKDKFIKRLIKILTHPIGIIAYLIIFTITAILLINVPYFAILGIILMLTFTFSLFVYLDYYDEKDKQNTLKKEHEFIDEHIEKLSNEKKHEIKKELDSQLNNIRKEKEELKNLKKILSDKKDLVNITNVFLFEKDGFNYIVNLKEINLGTANIAVKVELYDIFSNNKIDTFLGKHIEQIKNYGIKEDYGKITKIENIEPALLVYPSKLVPRYLLQQIYYNANNIDIKAPILRKRYNEK